MSAHAYIQYADVPQELIAKSQQHVDSATGAKVIAFKDCPFSGLIETDAEKLKIEFPFPRSADLRHSLVDWLMAAGISFTVVM